MFSIGPRLKGLSYSFHLKRCTVRRSLSSIMRNAVVLAVALATGLMVHSSGAQTPQQTPTPTPTPSTTPTPTPTPIATASISGAVVDAVTRQPIDDALVELTSTSEDGRQTTVERLFTDARGRFVFGRLPGGSRYRVTASKPGYFKTSLGSASRQNIGGPYIDLADGQWFAAPNFLLWPPASISGQVTDEAGEPVIGVFVRLLSQVRVGASNRWAVGLLAVTDDRGMYRIGNLQAGRYALMVPSVQASVPEGLAKEAAVDGSRSFPILELDSANRLVTNGYPVPPPPVDGRFFTYPIAFAGGKSLEQASMVAVQAGEDRDGVNVRLDPVPAVRISGRLDGPADARGGVFVRLLVRGLEELGWGSEAGTTVSGPDGSFMFGNVPAGNYILDVATSMSEYTIGPMGMFYAVEPPRPPGVRGISRQGGLLDGSTFGSVDMPLNGVRVWARTPVTATGDTTGIAVPLQPTISVGGKFVTEPAAGLPVPAPPRYMSIQSASGNAWQGTSSSVSARNVPEGEFRIEGLVSGEYLFDTSSNAGWMVKSVVANGRDHTFVPLDLTTSISDVVVTLTNDIPQLSGVVTAQAGGSGANVIVVAFPFERAQWTNNGVRPTRIKTTQTSSNGSFRLPSLPAGRYYVVAIPATNVGAWREPGFFERAAPNASDITLGWGEKKSISVRVADVR